MRAQRWAVQERKKERKKDRKKERKKERSNQMLHKINFRTFLGSFKTSKLVFPFEK
jgi:hypothetical protein